MSPPPSPLHRIEHLEDFTKHGWCNALLSDPSITKIMKRSTSTPYNTDASNTLFAHTLFTDDAVRAFLSMYRPGRGRVKSIVAAETAGDTTLGSTAESGEKLSSQDTRSLGPRVVSGEGRLDTQADLDEPESLILVSLGSGVDGATHRLHGGVIATLLDQVMGGLISYLHENTSATAELNVRYKKAITTPTIVLCRARVVKEAGRWIETVGWIEDGQGGVFAEGKASFVKSRVSGTAAKI